MTLAEFESFKLDIKVKFGSVARFGEMADAEGYANLNIQFTGIKWRLKKEYKLHASQRTYLTRMRKQYEKLNPELATSNEIPMADVVRIIQAVKKQGGVRKLCSQNKNFAQSSVYEIISGNRRVKTKTVKAVMTALGLD